MQRLLIFILIGIIIISMISALCEEGQIDINSATKEEMMKIIGLGGKGIIAQRVIDGRHYNSLNDLTNVNGIADLTLNKIKEQGLACVNEEREEENVEQDKNESEIKEEIKNQEPNMTKKETNKSEEIKMEIIKLDTKSIKTENNNENLDKTNYVKYSFVIFCTLLGFLLMLKKRKYKTEFDKK